MEGIQLTLSVKSTCHHKNASYYVNFTDNRTRSTLSSSLHIFLAKNNMVSWLNVQRFVLQKPISWQIGRICYVRHEFVQCACQSKSTILYKIMAKILIGLIKNVNIFQQPSMFNNKTKNTAPNRPMFDRFTQISNKQPSLLSRDQNVSRHFICRICTLVQWNRSSQTSYFMCQWQQWRRLPWNLSESIKHRTIWSCILRVIIKQRRLVKDNDFFFLSNR